MRWSESGVGMEASPTVMLCCEQASGAVEESMRPLLIVVAGAPISGDWRHVWR